MPLLICISMCCFFFFLCSLDDVIQHTHKATNTHTHTNFSLYSPSGNFITQISSLDSPGGTLINSHFTPFVLFLEEWEYCCRVAVQSVHACVHRQICDLQFIIQRVQQNLVDISLMILCAFMISPITLTLLNSL